MAQYDILLTQNTAASGIEYEGKVINIAKGGILSADTSQVPTIIAAGTDGYVLVRDDAETTGLKWVDPSTISTGVVVANQSNDRLITATATSDSLNAEQYLTYNTNDGLGVLAGNGIVFGSAATIWKIYTPDGAYANGLEISTGANSGGAAGDLTLKAGSGTSSGGNVFLRRDTTYGNFYFGTGSAGHLPAKASETNIVFYSPTSGKISYGSVPTGDVTASSYTQYDLAVWDSTAKNLVDTAGKLTWNSTVLYADTTTTEIRASSSISLSSPYVYLGSSVFAGGDVRVEAIGTSADIDIYLSPKGDGYLELGNGGPIGMIASQVQIYSSIIGIGNTTTDVLVYAQPGGPDHVTGFALTLKGGNAYNTGDNDGGNVYIYGGSPNGSGDFGNIYFGNGGLGLLPAKSAETNVVYYDTTTGLLSYGVAAGSMTYPGAGIPVSTGSAWGTSLGIANNTNNYVVTMTGSGLNGEANLQFNGTTLTLNGTINMWAATTEERRLGIGGGRSGNGYSYIDLIGDATYTDYGLRIMRGNGGANTSSYLQHRGTGNFTFQAMEAANMLFYTNNTTRMTILSDGKVGIGTSSPGAQLTINNSSNPTLRFNVTSGEAGASSGKIEFFQSNYSPDYARASIRAQRTGSASDGVLIFATAINANQAPIDRMIINQSGNVGIGTTTPDYKLQVNGTIAPETTGQDLGTSSLRWDLYGGTITATGDITGNTSDKRLKTGIMPIENALAKVGQLNGFTYLNNELAKELSGLDTTIRRTGVFAQDLQEVLPEAVRPAPFDTDENGNSISGENYLTVQYEKIVPLLIEAIKDLKKEIDELKIVKK